VNFRKDLFLTGCKGGYNQERGSCSLWELVGVYKYLPYFYINVLTHSEDLREVCFCGVVRFSYSPLKIKPDELSLSHYDALKV
jgi:hypothetical protein